MEIHCNKVVAFIEKSGLNWSYSHNLMGGKSALRKHDEIMIKFSSFLPPHCIHFLDQMWCEKWYWYVFYAQKILFLIIACRWLWQMKVAVAS